MAQNRADRRRAQDKNKQPGKEKKTGSLAGIKAWWSNFQREKSPVLIFLLRFSAVMVPFYIIWWTDFFKDYILAPWNELNAFVAGGVLNIFGAETVANGTMLSSGDAAISVMQGCDGIEPTMLFIAGVLAFPSARRAKVKGILWGTLFLLGTNFIRIVTLFIAAQSWPEGFEFLHREFWQVVFIVLAILAWGYWLSRLPKPTPPDAHVQLQAD